MNDTENIFIENEIKTNIMLAQILLVSFLIGLITSVCVLTDMFDAPRFFWQPFMIFGELLILAGVFICRGFRGRGKWMKYLLISILIVVSALLDVMFTASATLLICVPVILASQYYIRSFTINVSLITLVVFTISAILGANYGLMDLNCIELPLGTVIRMEDTTWLGEALADISYDHGLMIVDVLLYGYLPKIMLYSLFALAGIILTFRGRALILRQQELTAKASILGAELDMASGIQNGALPHIFPAFPDRNEFAIYATMDPAKEIGGDFYDFFLLDENHLALVVADVSGKGIPAALFMMISKTLLRSVAQSKSSPRDILFSTNASLAEDNDEDMFVTVWLGILTISTGELTFASAGHERLGLYQNGTWRLLGDHTGIALGMCDPDEMEELSGKYAIVDQTVTLAPGDAIFQYTDGVTEAMDETEELFGEQRLLDALKDAPEAEPDKLLPFLHDRIKEYVKDTPQSDDITMLGMIYRGVTGDGSL
ncbi:MAG: PP2C family protein-serine/threonine phosphatase [Lachnospiraceae bacterium]|nr:PP2C family protein-serine/threonine phosphatase [Lachnospiraceae bacterium]